MITGIREKTVVNENGKVEISTPDLPIGTEVEFVFLAEQEMDETEYLLSTEANRKHLEQAMRDAEDPAKRIYVDINNFIAVFASWNRSGGLSVRTRSVSKDIVQSVLN